MGCMDSPWPPLLSCNTSNAQRGVTSLLHWHVAGQCFLHLVMDPAFRGLPSLSAFRHGAKSQSTCLTLQSEAGGNRAAAAAGSQFARPPVSPEPCSEWLTRARRGPKTSHRLLDHPFGSSKALLLALAALLLITPLHNRGARHGCSTSEQRSRHARSVLTPTTTALQTLDLDASPLEPGQDDSTSLRAPR